MDLASSPQHDVYWEGRTVFTCRQVYWHKNLKLKLETEDKEVEREVNSSGGGGGGGASGFQEPFCVNVGKVQAEVGCRLD